LRAISCRYSRLPKTRREIATSSFIRLSEDLPDRGRSTGRSSSDQHLQPTSISTSRAGPPKRSTRGRQAAVWPKSRTFQPGPNEGIWGEQSRKRMAMGNRLWHTDSSFRRLPAKARCLARIPPVGGQTEFADARRLGRTAGGNERRLREGHERICSRSGCPPVFRRRVASAAAVTAGAVPGTQARRPAVFASRPEGFSA
jgi:hypothetical protein